MNRGAECCVCQREDRTERLPTDPPPAGACLLSRGSVTVGRAALEASGAIMRRDVTPPVIYVTGHRNPDTDSIASAIGYAELMRRIDPRHEYVPVRLGDVNTQTRWALGRAEAKEPEFLPHVMLRVQDVMRSDFPLAEDTEPVREVGRVMAREDLDLVPIVKDGMLAGVMTERARARRYIRESRKASKLDAPTKVSAIAGVLEGELVAGPDHEVTGRVWVMAMDIGSLPSDIGKGDVVVVGNRPDAHKAALDLGVGLLVTSNDTVPHNPLPRRANHEGIPVVRSPLDSYVTSRMITLSAPCRALMDPEPLTVRADELLSDIAQEVVDIHYRAAVAVDSRRHPIGLVTRGDLINPPPRRVILVDHAEAAQSVPGVEQAEIVEILDHPHI